MGQGAPDRGGGPAFPRQEVDPMQTLDGASVQLLPPVLAELRSRFRGDILAPESPGYDEARAVWNAMVDRRPALILRCADEHDVRTAVRFVAENRLLSSVRAGGHHIAGNAVCEDGVQIHLGALRGVAVNSDGRTAIVEAGCTLADVDAATEPFGLAVPLGINSTTGVAGLTLGGGFGWLARRYGMTVDSLVAADVVTAAGELVHASATEHPDLFWAIRGGGGNFGVVTRFHFRLHPVGPQVLAGLIVHPFDDAGAVLPFYRDFTAAAPDDLGVWVVLRKAPPLPFLPPEWHGREVVVLAACYTGADLAEGERVLAPLRSFGSPIGDVIAPTPLSAWQQAFDPLLTPGARNYWKSHDFTGLDDDLLAAAASYAARLPTDECEILIAQVGGRIADVPVDATAFAHRQTRYIMNVHTRWQDPAGDMACIAWARELFDAVAPYASGSVYSNFMPGDEAARIPAAYGSNYERLAAVKRRYDPANLFRMNQNIAPAEAASPEPRMRH
jgi:FAD/FMN-containing dehydrogenase